MYAVIKSGGRQFKVEVGETIEVNRLPVEEGTQIRISDVVLISDADRALIGRPLVENAAVLATVRRHARGKKVIVFKYKSKKRYRHRRGHRQEITLLTIDDVLLDGVSLVTGKAPEEVVERPRSRAEAGEAAARPAPAPVEEAPARAEPRTPEQPEQPEQPQRRRRRVRPQDGEARTEE
jgi:large subunit ribosomal protein L21